MLSLGAILYWESIVFIISMMRWFVILTRWYTRVNLDYISGKLAYLLNKISSNDGVLADSRPLSLSYAQSGCSFHLVLLLWKRNIIRGVWVLLHLDLLIFFIAHQVSFCCQNVCYMVLIIDIRIIYLWLVLLWHGYKWFGIAADLFYILSIIIFLRLAWAVVWMIHVVVLRGDPFNNFI